MQTFNRRKEDRQSWLMHAWKALKDLAAVFGLAFACTIVGYLAGYTSAKHQPIDTELAAHTPTKGKGK